MERFLNHTIEIFINGKLLNNARTLPDTLSIFAVSEAPENISALIWAHTICISQRDAAERNQQVSIMGEIYRQTSRGNIRLSGQQRHASQYARGACCPSQR